MKELLARALDTARLKGASYADARFVHNKRESISVKYGVVEALNAVEMAGREARLIIDESGCSTRALKIRAFDFTGVTV